MDINPAELSYIPTTGVKRFHEAPLVLATEASAAGYGRIDPKTFPIEITAAPSPSH